MKRIKQKLRELITDIENEVSERNAAFAKRKNSMSKDDKQKHTELTDKLGEMLNQLNDMAVELPEN